MRNIQKREKIDIENISLLSLSKTTKLLNFVFEKSDVDSNLLINSKKANCVGYAATCSSICNYYLNKYNLSNQWVAKHKIGQLYFLTVNIHQFFDAPFLKNHDFVIIENKISGEIIALDPTISDYLWIDYISYQSN